MHICITYDRILSRRVATSPLQLMEQYRLRTLPSRTLLVQTILSIAHRLMGRGPVLALTLPQSNLLPLSVKAVVASPQPCSSSSSSTKPIAALSGSMARMFGNLTRRGFALTLATWGKCLFCLQVLFEITC